MHYICRYDWWLPLGIAKFVSLAALRKMFGATEGYYHIMQVRGFTTFKLILFSVSLFHFQGRGEGSLV